MVPTRTASRVAALDLSEVGLKETEALANAGDRLSTHVLNIADRPVVLALPDAVVARHGQVDALINVAGIVHDFKPVADLAFSDIERVMDVNFWGTVNTTKAFLPPLRVRPEASLVKVASMGERWPVGEGEVNGHVPENQVRREAPGFLDGVLGSHARRLRSVVLGDATASDTVRAEALEDGLRGEDGCDGLRLMCINGRLPRLENSAQRGHVVGRGCGHGISCQCLINANEVRAANVGMGCGGAGAFTDPYSPAMNS
jgi:hypothetical protein